MYREMLTDPDVEFDYVLAETLSMTVGEVREMPAAEYVGWSVYLGRKAQRQQLASMTRGRRR